MSLLKIYVLVLVTIIFGVTVAKSEEITLATFSSTEYDSLFLSFQANQNLDISYVLIEAYAPDSSGISQIPNEIKIAVNGLQVNRFEKEIYFVNNLKQSISCGKYKSSGWWIFKQDKWQSTNLCILKTKKYYSIDQFGDKNEYISAILEIRSK
jgi:hypothetical protein